MNQYTSVFQQGVYQMNNFPDFPEFQKSRHPGLREQSQKATMNINVKVLNNQESTREGK